MHCTVGSAHQSWRPGASAHETGRVVEQPGEGELCRPDHHQPGTQLRAFELHHLPEDARQIHAHRLGQTLAADREH